MSSLRTCPTCGGYTLRTTCACGASTHHPGPARFRPDDPYGIYRRRLKQQTRAAAIDKPSDGRPPAIVSEPTEENDPHA